MITKVEMLKLILLVSVVLISAVMVISAILLEVLRVLVQIVFM